MRMQAVGLSCRAWVGCLLMAFVPAATAQRADVGLGVAASVDEALSWNRPADRARCPDRASYLWVQAVEGSACIRYFASDDIDGSPLVIVQLSGDRDSVMDLPPTRIPGNTEALRLRDARRSRHIAGVPWVFVARPGLYGSSGDHRQRRRPVEFHALDAALDALVRRHRIQRIVLLGHSGGATAAAALLTLGRRDVACAVLTSGAYGLLERARLLGRSTGGRTDTTGSTDFYDPLDHVNGIAVDPARRIVLIGNPDDRNTPFALQARFADAVARAGHRVLLQTYSAEPPEFHDLRDGIGSSVATQCAKESVAR
ncbi:hypothetical protein [Pseudacidovorax sp. NFM-22]|uniref:hypothetical protein n=1 Tax=Pseudacidovorax sp. NFM-22 TaxID=2744469 RepID=UPI001F1AA727|nr:hypothetical protein [Pseudacidovorax sp. NFM-22]